MHKIPLTRCIIILDNFWKNLTTKAPIHSDKLKYTGRDYIFIFSDLETRQNKALVSSPIKWTIKSTGTFGKGYFINGRTIRSTMMKFLWLIETLKESLKVILGNNLWTM